MRLRIEGLHSGSQGNVINNLQKGLAEIGMVDEDPQSTHHPMRSQMQMVWKSNDLEHRVKRNQHLIIVRPDLESCFLRSAARIKIQTRLPGERKDLHRILAVEQDRSAHEAFRDALRQCYDRSHSSGTETFITELAKLIRDLTK